VNDTYICRHLVRFRSDYPRVVSMMYDEGWRCQIRSKAGGRASTGARGAKSPSGGDVDEPLRIPRRGRRTAPPAAAAAFGAGFRMICADKVCSTGHKLNISLLTWKKGGWGEGKSERLGALLAIDVPRNVSAGTHIPSTTLTEGPNRGCSWYRDYARLQT
jgi:hypothetical protein